MDKRLTPQEAIYRSWRETKKPIIYKTKDGKGNSVEKEVDFADPEENQFYDKSYAGLCNMCGMEVNGGIPVKKMLSSSYMDWAIHKAPQASHLCRACAFCLGMNPVGRIALFRYPLVAERTMHLCNRKQFRDFLVSPPDPPFVMIMPITQKKHLFGKTKVSYSKNHYFCNLEEITVQIDLKVKRLIDDIEALRGIGFKKTDIESARIPGSVTKKYAFTPYDFERLIEKMEGFARDGMFGLALEVAQKMEEEKAACYLGLTQKMK